MSQGLVSLTRARIIQSVTGPVSTAAIIRDYLVPLQIAAHGGDRRPLTTLL